MKKKMKKFLLTFALGTVFAAASLLAVFGGPHKNVSQVKAADYSQVIEGVQYYEYDPKLVGQQYLTTRNNGNICTNVEQWHNFSTNDQCWVRFIVDVETAGNYKLFFNIGVTGNTDARFYVNNLTAHAVTTNQSYSGVDNEVTGYFNQGKNVFLVEMIWNGTQFNRVLLPDAFTVLSTNTAQTYYAMNADNDGLILVYGDDLFNPDAIIEPDFMFPNGYTITASYRTYAPNTSMTFHVNESSEANYYVHALNSSGSTNKEIIYSVDGGSESTITVPSGQTSTFQKLLVGTLSAGSHTIKFRQGSDSALRLKIQKVTAEFTSVLESIDSISGTMHGTKNDSWDLSELTVMGTFSDSATPMDITGLCELTVNSPSLANSGSGNNGSVTVEAEGLSKTFTNVSYEIVGLTNLTPAQIRQQTKILGRCFSNTDYISMDYSLSGLEFNYLGGGSITATFDVLYNDNNTRFVVEVDYQAGVYVPISVGANTSTTITLVSNLEYGFHHIVFYKTSEAWRNQLDLIKLSHPDTGTISKPVDHKLKIEVIGDSISCGVGISSHEDAYSSYALKLAKELDADISDVSVNGKGLVNSWDIADNWALGGPQMQEIWSKTLFYRTPDVAYDGSYDADIVIVNLGNNDANPGTGVTLSAFESGMVSMNTAIKNMYGSDTIIVWTYGSYLYRDWIYDLPEFVESLGDDNIHFVSLPMMGSGQNSHPNEAEHEIIAKLLKAYARSTDYRFAEAENHSTDSGVIQTAAGYNWSNNSYLGSMSGDKKFVSYDFESEFGGSYLVTVGVTASNTNIKYSLDATVVTGSETYSTSTWYPAGGTFKEYFTIKLDNVTPGEHILGLYNSTNGGWVNFDYFELMPMEDLNTKDQAFAYSFMNETHFECESSQAGLGFEESVWKNLELRYNTLTNAEKALVATRGELTARYNAVLEHHPTFSNFLEDGSGNLLFDLVFHNQNMSLYNSDSVTETLIIVFAAATTLITTFLYIKTKRRKVR